MSSVTPTPTRQPQSSRPVSGGRAPSLNQQSLTQANIGHATLCKEKTALVKEELWCRKNVLAANAAQKEVVEKIKKVNHSMSTNEDTRNVLRKIVREEKTEDQECQATPQTCRNLSEALASKCDEPVPKEPHTDVPNHEAPGWSPALNDVEECV